MHSRRAFGNAGILIGALSAVWLHRSGPNFGNLFPLLLGLLLTANVMVALGWGRWSLFFPIPFAFVAGISAYHPNPNPLIDKADFYVIFAITLLLGFVGIAIGIVAREKRLPNAQEIGKCAGCGSSIFRDALYCDQCGQKVARSSEAKKAES